MRTENFNKIDGNSLSYKMIIDGAELEAMLSESSRELQRTKELPGFRKGKIPLDVMLSSFGKEIYRDVADKHSIELYSRSVIENSLEPVGQPYLIISSASPEQMVISVVVSVYPDVELNQYKGLRIERPRDETTEEELDEALEQFCDLHRNVVPAERPAKEDDIIYFSYAVECDGKPVPSGLGSHVSQRLGREDMFPGLTDKMRGAVPGDELTMEIDMPEDHKRRELAGKHITLFVRIEEVKERRMPELTDELVHRFNKDCETVESFREKLRKEKNKYLKMAADEAFEKALKAELASQVKANIPSEMLELQLEMQYRNLENGLKASGSSIEKFMKESGYTPEQIRELSLPLAEQEVKFSLALDRIADIEGITVTDEELQREYKRRALRRNVTVKELKGSLDDEDVIESIRNEKAISIVRSTAEAVYAE